MLNEVTSRGSPNPPLVLIAAEDNSFMSLLEYILGNIGLSVRTAGNDNALRDQLQNATPDLLVLDASLPGIDVRRTCADIRLNRTTRSIAIIVLASGEDDDADQRTALLESGADDYVNRPFSPENIIGSIQTLLRQANRLPDASSAKLLTFRDLELDLASYRVRRSGRVIHLAPTEFRLLHHFMLNPRRVYSRAELQEAAWPRAVSLGPRTVDVHIGRLRAALNETGGQNLIRTVRSVGYALSD